MKIKLTTAEGFFSSSKHILIDPGQVVSVEEKGDHRLVTVTGGKEYEVIEPLATIEDLLDDTTPPASPATPTPPATPPA